MTTKPSSSNDFSPEVLKSFVEVQKKKLENENKELTIREKEILSNERLAIKSMELQAELLKEQPKQLRKNITSLAYIIIGIAITLMLFLGWLIYHGNQDFALGVIHKGSYVIVAILSYYVGKKNAKGHQNTNHSPSDVQQFD